MLTFKLGRTTRTNHLTWLAAFVGTSLVFSLGLACAVPLAAFAAISAQTQRRRDALLLVGAVWFTNQCVGFTALHYPTDLSTLGWGAAMGIAALAATLGAAAASRRISGLVGAVAAFLAAFSLYEALLWGLTIATNGTTEAYGAATLARIFALNAAAFGALLTASALAARVTLGKAPIIARRATQRHA
jgi:hypothetical protein